MFRKYVAAVLFFVLASWLHPPQAAYADLEWSLKKQLNLEAAPLDVAASADGKFIYVLASGEVLVYSAADDNVINRIPVDKAFDRITLSLQDNTLIVTSSSAKLMKLIALDFVHAFDLAGLAFKGPEKAPVVLAVFSDYQ